MKTYLRGQNQTWGSTDTRQHSISYSTTVTLYLGGCEKIFIN